MFRIIFITVTICLSGYLSAAQKPVFNLSDSLGTTGFGPNSREVIVKNGVVKTTVARRTWKDGKETSHPGFKAYYYDRWGKIIREEYLSPEGKAWTIDSLAYDANGRMNYSKLAGSDGTVHIEWKSAAGVGISKIRYSKDSTGSDTMRVVNDERERVKQLFYSRENIRWSHYYYYDGEGRIERIDNLDKDGKRIDSEVFKFVKNRKGSKLEVYKENDVVKEKVLEVNYNGSGECINTTRYLNNLVLASEEFKYNGDGTLLSQEIRYANKVKMIHTYNYIKAENR